MSYMLPMPELKMPNGRLMWSNKTISHFVQSEAMKKDGYNCLVISKRYFAQSPFAELPSLRKNES